MKFLVQLIVSALAVIITSLLLPGVQINSVFTAILVAAVLALLNMVVKPLLVVLTIPITVFTLGFFLLIINAAIILLTSYIVPGFLVNGFWTALLFSIILSIVTYLFNQMANKKDNRNSK